MYAELLRVIAIMAAALENNTIASISKMRFVDATLILRRVWANKHTPIIIPIARRRAPREFIALRTIPFRFEMYFGAQLSAAVELPRVNIQA
jgi:hypothetical protein